MPKANQQRVKKVPYVKGFRKPTKVKQLHAIGNCSEPDVERVFSYNNDSFADIPECLTIDDWLAQYKEPGQTYNEFVNQTPWLSNRSVKYCKQQFDPTGTTLSEKYPSGKIYILPFGFTENGVSPDIDALVQYTKVFYGLPVKVLPAIAIKEQKDKLSWVEEKSEDLSITHHLSTRYNRKWKKHQICVPPLLNAVKHMLPDDAICLMALTMYDLYEAKEDLFVAGMAAGNHRVGLFSLARYDPCKKFSCEFWYNSTLHKCRNQVDRQRTILLRSCRLLVHEIGHLLGLGHCIYFACLMNGSGHLEEDFRQPMFLCPVDLHKMYTLCGFNVIKRYESMLAFFDKHNMVDEKKWLVNRIQELKD